jgi:hypothetical protein
MKLIPGSACEVLTWIGHSTIGGGANEYAVLGKYACDLTEKCLVIAYVLDSFQRYVHLCTPFKQRQISAICQLAMYSAGITPAPNRIDSFGRNVNGPNALGTLAQKGLSAGAIATRTIHN